MVDPSILVAHTYKPRWKDEADVPEAIEEVGNAL